jgi:hypothetical protein
MVEEEKSRILSFEWLVTLSSSFSMGVAAAFVFSIESVNPTVQFSLTWKSWVSLVIVAWLTFWGCRALFFSGSELSVEESSSKMRRWFIFLTVLGLGGTAGGMAYSLKGVSHEKLVDVGIGVLLAAFFLSIVLFLFLKTIRFLQFDEEQNALQPGDERRG